MKEMVPIVAPRSSSQIKVVAESTVKKLFPDIQSLLKPSSLYVLFESGSLSKIGFTYGVEELPHPEEAHTDFQSNTIILSSDTYDSLEKGLHRPRFTLAHELGHAVLHTDSMRAASMVSASRQKTYSVSQNSAEIPKFMRGQIPAYRDPEWQANKFASFFLMPERLLDWLADRGMLMASTLARYACASEEAAYYRIKEYWKSRRAG